MNIRFYFQDIRQRDKRELRNYLSEKKLSRLTRLIRPKDLESAKFSLNAKYHRHNNIFLTRLVLEVPGNNLRSEESGQFLTEAFDLAFDNLISQLRKKESIRNDN